jgi:hypothetical protein
MGERNGETTSQVSSTKWDLMSPNSIQVIELPHSTFMWMTGSSYAECALGPIHMTFHIPNMTSFEEVAAILLAAMTATIISIRLSAYLAGGYSLRGDAS